MWKFALTALLLWSPMGHGSADVCENLLSAPPLKKLLNRLLTQFPEYTVTYDLRARFHELSAQDWEELNKVLDSLKFKGAETKLLRIWARSSQVYVDFLITGEGRNLAIVFTDLAAEPIAAKALVWRAARVPEPPTNSFVLTMDEAQLQEVLKKPLNTLGFSHRVLSGLHEENILLVRDLVTQKPDDLLRTVPNFGKKSLEEVEKVLAGLGLALGLHLP
jgi:hypothetical protein